MEDQFVLRLPPDLVPVLKGEINSGGGVSMVLQQNMRDATLTVGSTEYPATVMDLPTITETHKTVDHITYFKAGDISKMIVVRKPGEAGPSSYQLDSGLTPPTRHIRSKMYSKTGKKQTVERAEAVQRLVSQLLLDDMNPNVEVDFITEDEALALETDLDLDTSAVNAMLRIETPGSYSEHGFAFLDEGVYARRGVRRAREQERAAARLKPKPAKPSATERPPSIARRRPPVATATSAIATDSGATAPPPSDETLPPIPRKAKSSTASLRDSMPTVKAPLSVSVGAPTDGLAAMEDSPPSVATPQVPSASYPVVASPVVAALAAATAADTAQATPMDAVDTTATPAVATAATPTAATPMDVSATAPAQSNSPLPDQATAATVPATAATAAAVNTPTATPAATTATAPVSEPVPEPVAPEPVQTFTSDPAYEGLMARRSSAEREAKAAQVAADGAQKKIDGAANKIMEMRFRKQNAAVFADLEAKNAALAAVDAEIEALKAKYPS